MGLDNNGHVPVLLREVLDTFMPRNTQTFFDGTLGLGGHAEAILSAFPKIEYVACDLDEEHLNFARQRLISFQDRVRLHTGSFSRVGEWVFSKDKRPLCILLDLGLCSHHVDNPQKGFSFDGNGPLKMAFDGNQGRLAEDFLNHASENDIHRVLKEYGEEPFARRIAQKIVQIREEKPLETTHDLRKAVEASVYPQDRRKALTRVFQAIRIEINNELQVLEDAIRASLELMKAGDRLGIISYHSLEDRIVKKAFKDASQPVTAESLYSKHEIVAPAEFAVLTKKPLEPTDEEQKRNPRSRSAKFRILEKI